MQELVIMTRKPYSVPITGPVLRRRFTCKLNDGWWLIEHSANKYHLTPIDGWRVWWWRFRVTAYATWQGFGTFRF